MDANLEFRRISPKHGINDANGDLDRDDMASGLYVRGTSNTLSKKWSINKAIGDLDLCTSLQSAAHQYVVRASAEDVTLPSSPHVNPSHPAIQHLANDWAGHAAPTPAELLPVTAKISAGSAALVNLRW